MKTLNKFNDSIEGLYNALDKVRDVLDSLEDEELDSLTNRFIDQVEECINEGELTYHDLIEFLENYEQ
jgi:hypothetical protein